MAHTLACPRYPVAKLTDLIPVKYIEALEQNQLIASCCRHPEEHEVEAFYTCDTERDKGVPDLYIFHCTCGRMHRRLCCGQGDVRPVWEVR